MIHEVPNFIEPQLCQWVIDYFESVPKDRDPLQDKFFVGRTISLTNVNTYDVKKRFKVFEQMMVQTIGKLFPDDGYIFTENTNIVKWPAGIKWDQDSEFAMDPHVDNEFDREYDRHLTERDFTTICYLNDDYEGGHTFFPELDIECVPERGKVVFLPSTLLHGVTAISGNDRYTIATWFTKNREAIEF
tara:strand:+ start:516 stop:1079 length:564 start_codon:yes stop_codon:yes gene_type:complete